MAIRTTSYAQVEKGKGLGEEIFRRMDNFATHFDRTKGFYLQGAGSEGYICSNNPFLCFHYEENGVSAGVVVRGGMDSNPVSVTGEDKSREIVASAIEEITQIPMAEIIEVAASSDRRK
jgi:hypothetical protein